MEEFAKADLNSDDIISIDEFYLYFYSTICFKFPVLRSGVNPGADLLNIYMKYASSGKAFRCEKVWDRLGRRTGARDPSITTVNSWAEIPGWAESPLISWTISDGIPLL